MERTLWLADACIFESCLECALGCRGAWTGLGRLSCMRFANVDCECGGSAVPPFVPRVESEDARFLVLSGGRGDVDRSSPANCGESARAAAMALDKTRLSLRARLLRNARPTLMRRVLRSSALHTALRTRIPTRTFTVLAFESSADDSCVAIVRSDDRKILANVVIKQDKL